MECPFHHQIEEKLKGLTLDELKAWKPPNQSYIISHGLLLPQTKMIVFGKFETWKSMLSYHTAYTIATGRDWFGFRTYKTPVYTVQVEVPQAQLRNRIIKYAEGNKVDASNVWFATEHYIKLDKGFGISELEQELSRTKPGVLIIDPIFMVVSGRMTDEYDMRQFMDRMNLLIATYKFALILIHHDRKMQLVEGQYVSAGAEDMFGTSIFIDWCDTSIRTTTTGIDGEVILTFEKVRYAEEKLKPIIIQINRADLTFHRKGGG